MTSCVFCKIAAGKTPATFVYRDEFVIAFRDLHPVAPTHILITPRKHIPSVNELIPDDEALIGHMFAVARQIAGQEGIQDSGYRIVVNTGAQSGQTIFHLHLHLIGGQHLSFPGSAPFTKV